ncbi:MAG: glutaminase [Gammaproteobacteria bacterium]|jgi:glutaminase|nr:glutaminase [Gammaproteobacteria bacterium]
MQNIQQVIDKAVEQAKHTSEGQIASYIPELANVPADITAAAIILNDGQRFVAGDFDYVVTLQSVAKLIVLIGLLEEFGKQKVFSWVKAEPSGDDFASVARLDQFGPKPSNPMLNAGAIALCGHIPGANPTEQINWLKKWTENLFGEQLTINQKVYESERQTGHRNRSLAYLLKANGIIEGDVEDVLEVYFALCSFEANIKQAAYLPMLLANRGLIPHGQRIMSKQTVQQVVAIMATCGLYNESGGHLVRTGMPAKSGVSGLIVSVALGQAGVAVLSPRVNRKGNSMRGELILEYISQHLDWHFAN